MPIPLANATTNCDAIFGATCDRDTFIQSIPLSHLSRRHHPGDYPRPGYHGMTFGCSLTGRYSPANPQRPPSLSLAFIPNPRCVFRPRGEYV